MDKKTYQQPQAKIYALKNQPLLGASEDANSREVGTLWDDGGE